MIIDGAVACSTCQKPAPPVTEIQAAHGLARMGWHCSGGTHICPACPHPAATIGSVNASK